MKRLFGNMMLSFLIIGCVGYVGVLAIGSYVLGSYYSGNVNLVKEVKIQGEGGYVIERVYETYHLGLRISTRDIESEVK